MAIKVYKPGERPKSFRRVALYGDPKIGKSRLATSLPWGEYGWGEKAVYVAWDPGTEDWENSPILEQDREHLIFARGEAEIGKDGRLMPFDPLEAAIELASRDWKSVDPEIETIIWDTMTYTATDLLAAIAPQGLYGNNITLGKRGTNSHVAQPQQGDYGAAQNCVKHILDFLFSQPLNVIVLFHAKMTDPEDAEVVGGPATAGKAGIRPIAGLFDNLFRIGAKRVRIGTGTPPTYETHRVVYTEPNGYWLAGMRSPQKSNNIKEFRIDDKEPVSFWHALEKAKGAK